MSTHKLMLFNLPKYDSAKKVTNLLVSLSLPECKVKKVPGKTFAEVVCESENEAKTIKSAIDEYEYKEKKLSCIDKAEHLAKREATRAPRNREQGSQPEVPVAIRLRPWADVPYEETLSRKATLARKSLRGIYPPPPKVWPAPEDERVTYRNKIGLTFGAGGILGWRKGRTGDGSTLVEWDASLVTPHMARIVDAAVAAVRASAGAGVEPSVYDPVDKQDGFWRYLTLRCFGESAAETMVIAEVNADAPAEEGADAVDPRLVALGAALYPELASGVYVQYNVGASTGVLGAKTTKENFRRVAGTDEAPVVVPLLDGQLKFRVSPASFFQTYLSAANALYGDIRAEVAAQGDECIVLDLCCGTGTIGIACAGLPNVKAVYGIELIPEAIEDAKDNAERNGVADKCTWIVGYLEKELKRLLHNVIPRDYTGRIVGILDPPRAGVGASVLSAIRGATRIDRLIYVACNHKTLKVEGIALTKPPSKKYPGTPFRMIHAGVYDMFPHTDQFELYTVFERRKGAAEAEAPAAAPATTTETRPQEETPASSAEAEAPNTDAGASSAAHEEVAAPTTEAEAPATEPHSVDEPAAKRARVE